LLLLELEIRREEENHSLLAIEEQKIIFHSEGCPPKKNRQLQEFFVVENREFQNRTQLSVFFDAFKPK